MPFIELLRTIEPPGPSGLSRISFAAALMVIIGPVRLMSSRFCQASGVTSSILLSPLLVPALAKGDVEATKLYFE